MTSGDACKAPGINATMLGANRLFYMRFITISYRSFAALRMTTWCFVVILSVAKDLYMRIAYNDTL